MMNKWAVEPNVTYALILMEEAANLGSNDAILNLAKLYIEGVKAANKSYLVKPNITKAVELLFKAMPDE